MSLQDARPSGIVEERTVANWRDLAVIVAVLLLLLLLVAVRPWAPWLAPVQALVGAVVMFVVPGYCLQALLFPIHDDLDGYERLGLSLGFSVGVLPLLVLVLEYTPGLDLSSEWLIISHATLVLLLVALVFVRRQTMTSSTPLFAPSVAPRTMWRQLPPIERRVYLGSLVAVLLVMGVTTWVVLRPTDGELLTEFYILGAEGQAVGYPREAVAGEPVTVTMGITNQEQTAQTYNVEVWVTWAWDPAAWETMVKEVGPITLEPGATLEQSVEWEMPWSADDVQVFFNLKREGDAEPYRQTMFVLDVLPNPDEESQQSGPLEGN